MKHSSRSQRHTKETTDFCQNNQKDSRGKTVIKRQRYGRIKKAKTKTFINLTGKKSIVDINK